MIDILRLKARAAAVSAWLYTPYGRCIFSLHKFLRYASKNKQEKAISTLYSEFLAELNANDKCFPTENSTVQNKNSIPTGLACNEYIRSRFVHVLMLQL